jgi:hypothetical protein
LGAVWSSSSSAASTSSTIGAISSTGTSSMWGLSGGNRTSLLTRKLPY